MFFGDMPCTGFDIDWVLKRVSSQGTFILKGHIKVLIYNLTFPGKWGAVRAGSGPGPEKQGALLAIAVNFLL